MTHHYWVNDVKVAQVTLEDESATYQLVGGVKAHQGEDG